MSASSFVSVAILAFLTPALSLASEADALSNSGSEVLEGTFEVREIPDVPLRQPVGPQPIGARFGKQLSQTRTAAGIAMGTCGSASASPFASSVLKSNVTGQFAGRSGVSAPKKPAIPDSLQKSSPTLGIPELTVIEVVLDQIINIGKKVWKVVDAGKSIVNLSTDVATALPKTVNGQPLCWTDLENWQAPRSRTFQVTFRNIYGTVVDLRYRILFVYGGSYEGKGRYIGYAAIDPSVDLAWGYNVDIEASTLSVFNIGNKSSPVAAMNLQIKYTITTALPLKTASESKVYYITGQGDFEELE